MIYLEKLLGNILNKITYLKQDYVGLHFNFNVLVNLFFGFTIAFSLTAISYLLGKKIIKFLFKKDDLEESYLVNLAVGYIIVATGITILGLFSFLTPLAISAYLILIILISFYPYNNFLKLCKDFYLFLLKTIKNIKKNKLVSFWVILFIFLATLNLINPEMREDQYHVDFPKMYLENKTIMIPPKEGISVSGSPMLGEMYYTIGIFLWSKESARYIHFTFYILVLLTLFEFSKLKNYKFSIYNLLLFATAPVIIHETSSMYVDFEWLFCFLLPILILSKNKKFPNKHIALAGFILGGMLSSKLWTIVFIPLLCIYLLYLLKKTNAQEKIKKILLFFFSSLVIPSIWFIRAYILTGNPIYPAFSNTPTLNGHLTNYEIPHYLGINIAFLNPQSLLTVFSPLFFFGVILFFYKFRQNTKEFFSLILSKFLILLLILYTFVQYPFGRYLMGLYIVVIFFSSFALSKFLKDFKFAKYLINMLLAVLFLYYFINSLLILPYSLGIADKNRYLTRILSRDWSSYYDFYGKFNKHISKNDYVATYEIFGFYYANFRYLDINFVFDRSHKSFAILKKKGFTKLFIKGGNMNYFCKRIDMKDCGIDHYSLVSNTNPPNSIYYLYNIK
jgi:hypothetical protein